jgi:hypothetical protein
MADNDDFDDDFYEPAEDEVPQAKPAATQAKPAAPDVQMNESVDDDDDDDEYEEEESDSVCWRLCIL